MIKHLRIDNRLIHGQVAVAWQKYINAKVIIVCNDAVAKDPIQKMALPLAARESKVLVYSIEETIRYAKEHADEQVFVIAKFPQDALAILEAGEKVAEINVGNAAPVVGTKYVMVTRSIAATKEDAEVYRKVAERNGGKLTSQIMPSMEISNFLDALRKAGL
jgi:mannose/fructose/N-acetylgalactosamine-specific phosphotransferase system component IIB